MKRSVTERLCRKWLNETLTGCRRQAEADHWRKRWPD